MSYLLTIYSGAAFRNYLLPAVNDADYSILLENRLFRLGEDVELKLEVADDHWRIVPSKRYRIENIKTKEKFDTYELKDDDILALDLKSGARASMVVSITDSFFEVYRKYDISDCSSIMIGMNPECQIVYSNLGLVSRKHCTIKKAGNKHILEDTSSNGTYVNSEKTTKNRQLNYGDEIDIFGLRIIYLGNVIAMNTGLTKAVIQDSNMREWIPNQIVSPGKELPVPEKKTYHRSPRQFYKIDRDIIEIEAPPQHKEMSKKPISMIIGPSMTMAIPMLLGCGLAIISSTMSGNAGSAFMYTGLITAVSSALIGTIWAIVNLNYEKKKNREEELHRFDAYGDYLIKRSNQIKEKYEKNKSILKARYMPADQCAQYDEKVVALWNRNIRHDDFLSHRVGVGNMPFQVSIQVPKEKFSLINDSLAEKPQFIKDSYKTLYDVPICVDMNEHRLVGIVGGEKRTGSIQVLHNLVTQIAVSNCYTEVKMAFVFDETVDDTDEWNFAKWLPHVWSEDKRNRYVARNKEEASDVFFELTKVFRSRIEQTEGGTKNQKLLPAYILFVSDPSLLEGELINKYILEYAEGIGLSTVILAEKPENLPNECSFIIENDQVYQGMYSVDDDIDDRLPIRFDRVSAKEVEFLARRLSNIEVYESETGGDIPTELSFFDMYGVNHPAELHAIERWKKNRTYESMRAMIGQRAGATPWYLDIHEKFHGPHGLIAGTTGSGKSETLQTYILSLALNYSPDDIGFFIIDYKGGGMANLFDGLPHMIGQISNLSGNQVRRAMVSIKSENKRRQRIFNEHGVNNINLYTRLYKNKEAQVPIPHMFIIIDEFAELKREEPDFMRELISVAQVGRSLGVHLILATQKPSGTVDDNIWSNSKFRLCLRVQDRQDSNDMLHRPDAAYITQAGRCYMQVGNDELFELFQSGYSGATYNENASFTGKTIAQMVSSTGKAAIVGNRMLLKEKEATKQQWITQLLDKALPVLPMETDQWQLQDQGWTETAMQRVFTAFAESNIDYPENNYNRQRVKDLLIVYMAVQSEQVGSDPDKIASGILAYAGYHNINLPEKKEKTQLDAVVEYLDAVAKQNGYDHNLQLWLPVLPTELYLSELDSHLTDQFTIDQWKSAGEQEDICVNVGMFDDPVNQAQGTVTINLTQGGHHAVLGMVVSGKSTFMQTLAYALVRKYSPDEINMYLIDFSAKMLSAFENMPQVGGVVYENEDERIAKLFHLLGNIVEERKKLFKGGNFVQYVHAHGNVVPSVIVMIDNYSNFAAKTSNAYDDQILSLAKDGVGYGIYMILSGGGFSTLEIPMRIGENIRTCVSLEMNDKYQYADAMRTMHIEVIPEVNVKGRGLIKVGDAILEFQTALSLRATDDFDRIEKIISLGEQMSEAWTGKRARMIPEIPEQPICSEFMLRSETEDMLKDPMRLPIGYNKASADTYGIDLSKTYCYLICGKARTGKTNTLKVAMDAVGRRKGVLVTIDYNGELNKITENYDGLLIDSDQKMYDFFNDLIPEFKKRNQRKKEDIAGGMTDDEIFSDMQQYDPMFIFIANLADFIAHVSNPTEGVGDMRGFIENLLDKGELHNVFWFACYNPDDITKVAGIRTFDLFSKDKNGIFFGGNVDSQRLFGFDYLPYSERGKIMKQGEGLLAREDADGTTCVVVPLYKG